MCFRNLTKKSALRVLLLAVGAASAALLGVALVAQYKFDLHPCELCMKQRYPYTAIFAVGWLSAAFIRSERWLGKMAILCGLLFLLDAGIAGYHAGVEAHIFPGPSSCTNSGGAGETLEQMRAEIMGAELVSCDQPMVHVLGLSMAAWNGIAAALLAVATFGALINIHKRKQAS